MTAASAPTVARADDRPAPTPADRAAVMRDIAAGVRRRAWASGIGPDYRAQLLDDADRMEAHAAELEAQEATA